MRSRTLDDDARASWDRLVADTPGTDVTQLSAWATVRGQAGYTAGYVMAYRDARLVRGAQVLTRRVAKVLRLGYVPYGPVLTPGLGRRGDVVRSLVDGLAQDAAGRHLTVVQPPDGAAEVTAALIRRGFRPPSADIAPVGSYRIDLSRPLPEIRANLSKRLKYWTNQWPSRGVTVRRGDLGDVPLLVELMGHSARRHGYTPLSLEYVRTLHRELGDRSAIFVGEVAGVPVAADLVTICAGMVRGRLGGFRADGPAGKMSVPAAVRWEIVRWAQARGERWLDFGGLPGRMLADMIDQGIHASDEWPSAQRSKLSWGGMPYRYPPAVELWQPAEGTTITRSPPDPCSVKHHPWYSLS